MALKLYATRHGVDFASPQGRVLEVVALQNGYHGDTLGVMDCAPASVFNEQQTPWYKARGLFLDPPTCGVERGDWVVRSPGSQADGSPHTVLFGPLEGSTLAAMGRVPD